ncbi:hypothetical protein BDZ85DRAFT_279172 [Elsinoe ampelina]|uniref:Uncharacterized protein n=1 Tax=Elsinoe ampelina TaxID=302913 RepID=A0A6A6GIF1_9PEZI|nr:hypothetical protein BDZ85DRAFT_279172 [Elsinoe ampelina]
MFNSTSATTVVASEPPQIPPGRKPSLFEAMFDNFKFGSGRKEEDEHSRSSMGSADEKANKQGNHKIGEQEVTSPFSINETRPLEEPKRSLSVAIADVFRRPSESSSKSRSSSPQRKASTASSGARKLSFFASSNPDPDNDVPRNASIHSHQSATHNNESADLTRKGSYIPRNATNSFLKSASGLTLEERAKRVEEVNEAKRGQSISGAAASRKASLALSDTSEASAVSSGRRPSGMMPNNVAARYMRSASTSEDKDGPQTGSRRRSSRQNSNGDGAVKAVSLAPEQYQQWQNSVSKARVGSFTKPGETALSAHRMQSLGGIANIAETADEPADEGPMTSRSNSHAAPTFAITPASPPGTVRSKRGMNIDTDAANEDRRAVMNKIDSAFMGDAVSPRNMTFGVKITATTSGRTSAAQSPEENETLEKLGFRGAIPT